MREGTAAGIGGLLFQFLLDAQELIVLLDGEVSDEGVRRLAAAVGDDRRPARAVREVDRLEGLGEGADLVQFDEDGVARVLADAPFEEGRVRDEEIVADELNAVAQTL